RHGLIADWGFAFCGEFRDQGGRIRGLAHLLSQVLWLIDFFGVAKEIVNIFDSRAGENPFATYAAMFSLEIGQQFHVQFISGGEVGVAAFASERVMAESIPIKACHSEPGAGGDDSTIAFGVFGAFT